MLSTMTDSTAELEPLAPADGVARRRAMLALALLVPVPTIGVVSAMFDLLPAGLGQAIYAASKLWLFGLPVAWLLFVERKRISLSPMRQGGLGVGVGLGLLIAVVIGAVWWIAGDTLIDPATIRDAASLNGLDRPLVYLGLVSYLTLINALLEEYAWRWFVFRQCERLMPAWAAVLVSAAMFTLHHVFALKAQLDWPATALCSLGVFIGGAVWSWCYLRFRSVWPGYVSHAIVDAAIFIIGWQLIFGQ